ncbi:N-acetylmuramoyl-L-alanine amidase [Streptomyces cylindrosporus]|uniref:N-acetylmuramoyl-L-alanine amidase n=1 Tax=Streptomyces cylindrosporus TaxID=2927583 RepID=A0ABS9Y2V2_9ACTN|nr:N-acetylmuramoyl-L-alanine amidase [Streptomyces cylindrosporus]MCI3271031.1 N-acetylmuramoyl-L-alanine amidase [Streptomyces cylindrosporus]
MSTPMTADQLMAQLKKWGVKYQEYRSWRTHNRAGHGAWGPVNGFMVHHTGSDASDQRSLLYNGTAALPGPLCHFGLAQDGTVHLIGWGRANHAGAGDPDVLKAVENESYGAYPPADNQSSVDGNARFYGVEIWYSGSHKMSDAQYATLRKLAAALCDFHGWSAKSVIAHAEWGSPGKWDPGMAPGKTYDMAVVRADIAATLASKSATPSAPSTPTPKPSTPAKPSVSLSKLVTAAKRNPSAKGTPVTYSGVRTVEAALVKAGLLSASKADGHYGTDTIKAYAAWQHKCGYSGKAADGVPGPSTLRKLAAKYGFTVTA